MNVTFNAELWLYQGEGSWVFVTLPKEPSEDIKLVTSSLHRRGFGAVKVRVTVNEVEWSTSIFPDASSGSYMLPIKKDIRAKAGISVGDTATFVMYIEGIS